MEFEKSPGWDWEVDYEDEADEGRRVVETMSVFGQITIEAAIQEARRSLTALLDAGDPAPLIVACRRA